jgi:hypothetical protein
VKIERIRSNTFALDAYPEALATAATLASPVRVAFDLRA